MPTKSLESVNIPGITSNPLIKIENLTFGYDGKPVLNGLNLSLGATEVLGLAGKNGSGKTTLFRCITGLEKWQSGKLEFFGENVHSEKDFQRLRRKVGYVLQNPDNQLVFPTVLEDIMFGPLNLGLGHEAAQERALSWLGKIGLAGFENRLVSHLSGGEKRLVALAGILVMEPDLLLLDEPLNELDRTACERVVEIIKELDCACIIVSHDFTLFKKTAGNMAFLENGQLRTE